MLWERLEEEKILKRINRRVAAEETRMKLQRWVAMGPHIQGWEAAGFHKQLAVVENCSEPVAKDGELVGVVMDEVAGFHMELGVMGMVVVGNCSEQVLAVVVIGIGIQGEAVKGMVEEGTGTLVEVEKNR